jgi:phosphoribosylcarboxyaminoimidazole (NCAIR) mutase
MTTNMHNLEHIIVIFIFFHIINEIFRIVKAFLSAEIDIFGLAAAGGCATLPEVGEVVASLPVLVCRHCHFVGVFLSW